ncbi:hypothetical protein [Bradyrhizobium sp. STM 3562]|uniref:hypothetical protein n=1 Tax=Bradyrhizobium sp. STM 3562 TaxID=578924 RepID=UPI00388DBECB
MFFGQQIDQQVTPSVIQSLAPASVSQFYEVVPNVSLSQLSFGVAFMDEERLEVQFDGKTAEHVKCHEKRYVIR